MRSTSLLLRCFQPSSREPRRRVAREFKKYPRQQEVSVVANDGSGSNPASLLPTRRWPESAQMRPGVLNSFSLERRKAAFSSEPACTRTSAPTPPVRAGRVFANKNQLVAFCGLDVCARRSGMWKRPGASLVARQLGVARSALCHCVGIDPTSSRVPDVLPVAAGPEAALYDLPDRHGPAILAHYLNHMRSLHEGSGTLALATQPADGGIEGMAALSPG